MELVELAELVELVGLVELAGLVELVELVELAGLVELVELVGFLGEGGLSGEQLLLHRCFGLPSAAHNPAKAGSWRRRSWASNPA